MEKFFIRLGLVIILLLVIVIISSYVYYRVGILGNISYDIIDKSDSNLGITNKVVTIDIGDKLNQYEQEEEDEKAKETEDSNDKGIEEEQEKPNEKVEKEIYRFVLIGTDSRDKNSRGRSDAMMVVSLNITDKEIKLGSFLRDLQVDIKGIPDKLNHSYSYDGGVGVIRALNSNFNLDIKDYVIIDMFRLRGLVDMVGGVEVEILKEEIREINYRIREAAELEGWLGYTLLEETGLQKLNGEQAVAYMRIRNTKDGDISRSGRQREVITLLIQELNNKNLLEVLEIVKESAKAVTTTLDVNNVESLVLKLLPILNDIEIVGEVFPNGDLAYVDTSTGVYYFKIRDIEKFKLEVKEFLGYTD